MTEDISTEQLILNAAKEIFLAKGMAAARMQEIADKAGINKAMLHYYFRTKEKLFELVMLDNMATFVEGAAAIIHNEATSLDEKIDFLVSHYTNVLIKNPDVPQFVLNEIRSQPEKISAIFNEKLRIFESPLMKQISESIGNEEIVNIAHPAQFMVNLLALTIFPFIAKPMLMKIGQVDDPGFAMMMETRKTLIPIWIKSMYKVQNESTETAIPKPEKRINKPGNKNNKIA
jgi:AcrR family transcriptional regulator